MCVCAIVKRAVAIHVGWRGGRGTRSPSTGREQPPRQNGEVGRPGTSETLLAESSWACVRVALPQLHVREKSYSATALCLISYRFLSMSLRAIGTYPHAIWASVLSKNSLVTKGKDKLWNLLTPISDILFYGNKLVCSHTIIIIKNTEITWFLQCKKKKKKAEG